MLQTLLARLRRLSRRLHHRRPPAPRGVAGRVEDPAELTPEERVLGCGWFDSSHDLQAGLCVQEHASADAVAQELPLGDWLQLHLSGWRGAPGAPGGMTAA